MADIGMGMIALEEPEDFVADEEGTISWNPDGTIAVTDGAQQGALGDPADHNANLAAFLEEGELFRVAEDLIEAFENDKQARKQWEMRLAKGMETVGYVEQPADDLPFKGAASVVYPLIAEAVTQFNARALDELFPAAGPVKTVVVGKKTQEKEAQADRVADYMNYQITEEDPGWQEEDDRLLARLPLDGHGWKKVYRDERMGIQTSRYVPASDVFVPYNATSMHSLPRLCHQYVARANEVRFEQLSGNWLDVELQEPVGADEVDRGDVATAIGQAEGTQPAANEELKPAKVHTILEFYVDYDLPGFEHVSDATDEPTGFALPYLITVERDSRKVLAISRNWRENDQRYRKRMNLVPFRFLPGLGFYGFGFLHVIGSLNDAATGTLRALLDSAAFENLQGGFVSSDVGMKADGNLTLARGEWKKLPGVTAEEMGKAFFTPPRHPPSEALFKVLGLLVEAGKSYTSTTEAMTGAASTSGPVGTLVALIEQGSKVFSGIHKRLHKSKRDEYRLLAELNFEHVPPDGYPYDAGDESRMIFAKDFGPQVDVLPVSDPNIYSTHQKIAIAQAVVELAEQHPDMYDLREAHKRMLEAMKVPDIDGVLPEQGEKPHQDPVTENMLMLAGKPAQAFPDQQQEAHIQVHMAFMQNPGFGGNPDVQKVMAPLMMAHLAEHLAYLYQQRMMQAGGLPYVPVDVSAGGTQEPIPPEIQEEIAVRAAMATPQFMQMPGLPAPEQGPDPAQIKAEAAAQMAEVNVQAKQADMALKGQTAANEEQRKAAAFSAEQGRAAAGFAADQQRQGVDWALEQQRQQDAHELALKQQREAAEQARKLKERGQRDKGKSE